MLHVSHLTLLLYSNYHHFNVKYFIWVAFCISVWTVDGEEWDQQCLWHSELLTGLDKVDVSMEQLQQGQEKWLTQGGDWATTLQTMVRKMALWSIFWQLMQLGQMFLSSHQCLMYITQKANENFGNTSS